MKIDQLNLKCFDLENMKKFYTNVMEMTFVNESQNHFSVMAGTTKLVFEKDSSTPFYHVCFRTSEDYYQYVYEKLGQESVLLSNEDGEYSMFWKGKQAYFTDPDGNIIEMLERPFHENHKGKQPFGWFDVGEIGMPVSDIADMQNSLEAYIEDVEKSSSETFSFFGDKKGVFVLVKEGRHWYPTERSATIFPLKVYVTGNKDKTFVHETYPYEIIVRKEEESRFVIRMAGE